MISSLLIRGAQTEDHVKEPRRAHKSNEFNALFVAYQGPH
jgi:hypothetical protein